MGEKELEKELIELENELRKSIKNEETIQALLEAKRIANDPNVKGYTVEEAFEELKKD